MTIRFAFAFSVLMVPAYLVTSALQGDFAPYRWGENAKYAVGVWFVVAMAASVASMLGADGER